VGLSRVCVRNTVRWTLGREFVSSRGRSSFAFTVILTTIIQNRTGMAMVLIGYSVTAWVVGVERRAQRDCLVVVQKF
jgi:hypothetical protein